MKRFWQLLIFGFVFIPVAFAGASFKGIDKAGNYLIAHFSTGDVQIPLARGVTDGTSTPAGYVGQIIDNSATSGSLTANTYVDAGTITLTAGRWLIWGDGEFSITGTCSSPNWALNVNAVDGTTVGKDSNGNQQASGSGLNLSAGHIQEVITISTSQVVKFRMKCGALTGTVAATGYVAGLRLP